MRGSLILQGDAAAISYTYYADAVAWFNGTFLHLDGASRLVYIPTGSHTSGSFILDVTGYRETLVMWVANRTSSPVTAYYRTYPPLSTTEVECGRKQLHITVGGWSPSTSRGGPGQEDAGQKTPALDSVRRNLAADVHGCRGFGKLARDTVYAQNVTQDRISFPEGLNVVRNNFRDHYGS